jgi:hypothetical protein
MELEDEKRMFAGVRLTRVEQEELCVPPPSFLVSPVPYSLHAAPRTRFGIRMNT